MKMLGAMWASFGCILMVILRGANTDTVVYAGRSALLSYSPARGEFPVQSLIGRGYFSYVDQNGNSNIVSLEPNPLLGVRVSASGQPLDESVVENLAKAKDGNSNKDRLKPIKEFDKTPFVDSLNQKDINLASSSLSQDLLPLQSISKSTDAGQQVFLYQLPAGVTAGRQAGAGIFNPTNPFLPPIFPVSSAPGTVVTKPSVFPNFSGNRGQNPFLFPNMGLVVTNPSPVMNLGMVPANTSPNNVSPITTSQADIPLPTSPLPTGSGVFLNPAPPAVPITTSAPPIADILSTPTPLLTPSPDSTFSNQNSFTSTGTTTSPLPSGSQIIGAGNPFLPSSASVFPNSSPPPASPTTIQSNLQSSLQPCKSPSIIVSGPLIPNNMNPFLPQRTDLDSQAPTLSPAEIEAITNNIDIKSSMSGQAILSPPLDDETAIPKQVTDTPEVEEAKREHFLAHQQALAQLELAEQSSDNENESSSPSISAADSSSVYLPPDVASFQAVTSGPSTAVITEQTKLTGTESLTVS